METSQEGGHSDLVIRLLYLKDLLIKTSEVAPQNLIFVLLYAEQVSDGLLVAAPSNKMQHEGPAQLNKGGDGGSSELGKPLPSGSLQGGRERPTHDLIGDIM